MKSIHIIFLGFALFDLACTFYNKEDHEGLCGEQCSNMGRICIDGNCDCPPNTYKLPYTCFEKQDTIYRAFMDTSFHCGKQLLIHVARPSVNNRDAVRLQFEDELFETNWFGSAAEYFDMPGGDSIYISRMSFSQLPCWPTDKAMFHAKFKGEDTLHTWFYFYKVSPGLGFTDSLKITFTH